MKRNPIIQFKDVSKVFADGSVGLQNVTFSIKKGEFAFVIGSSGAGKTTLMKHIVREETPTEGEIIVDGINLADLTPKNLPQLRRKVGFIYQDFKLLDRKTAFENVSLSLEVVNKSEKEIEETVPKLLELVGLGDMSTKFPFELSGGEKQRLAIARALAHEPKIILADEPTGNLDEGSTWLVVDLLKKINEWGTTVIFGTHDKNIVNSLESRVLHLDKGKLISDKRKGFYE